MTRAPRAPDDDVDLELPGIAHADADDLRLVTIAVNGGTIGIKERESWLKRTKAVWPCA